MKKHLILFFIIPLFTCCSNSDFNNINPYIPNYTVNILINMDLPEYNDLKYVSNGVYYSAAGAKGVFVFNTGSGYNAFDAACPNQPLSSCSALGFKKLDPKDPYKIDETNVVCPCDNNQYSLFTGQGNLQYPLKQYRVEINGRVLRIYN
jgi:nitrite reductase/ring-hydroxylating ferredoxin subunit